MVSVGLIGTGTSFVYDPENNRVEIYKSVNNAMRNTWIDVVILNLCLFTFVHFVADRAKNPYRCVALRCGALRCGALYA